MPPNANKHECVLVYLIVIYTIAESGKHVSVANFSL